MLAENNQSPIATALPFGRSSSTTDRCRLPQVCYVDNDGTITETSISNIAIVKAEKISSPPRDRVLRGITQAFVEQMAREIQIDWSNFSDHHNRPDLMTADEVLLMGTDGGSMVRQQRERKRDWPTAEARPTYQSVTAAIPGQSWTPCKTLKSSLELTSGRASVDIQLFEITAQHCADGADLRAGNRDLLCQSAP